MRYQGRIASWNSHRGFGFIKQEQGGADLFVHITTLQFDGRPPEVGEKVSYLIGSSKDGKPCAVQVFFPDRPLSLAGVMGGQESEVTSETRNVLLEGASWNLVNVRRTVSGQRLNSEAAYRRRAQEGTPARRPLLI